MKLLIAIHVSFCDSHVNRWTGCSAEFLERIVHVKNEVLLEDCVREDLQKQACTPVNSRGGNREATLPLAQM